MNLITDRLNRLLKGDAYLQPYADVIKHRLEGIEKTTERLTLGKMSLADFAAGREYFGLHFRNNEWVFREWAPNATAIYLIGEMTDWQQRRKFSLEKGENGVWEIRLSRDKLEHGALYRLRIYWPGGEGDRIPAYARRVIQDPVTKIFNAQVWQPPEPYRWKKTDWQRLDEPPFIYEAHIGMAQEEEKIGTYREFTHSILPRIIASGYNTLQLMAVQEHPYYGSFGYQVSNFFAASSR